MNGNQRRIVLISLFCFAVGSALAQERVTSMDAPFSDPLNVRPATLDQNIRLPGDSAALHCPSVQSMSVLTLSQAVDLALCNNPQIKLAWAGIKIQAGALGEAQAAYLPTLTLAANRLTTRTSYPNALLPSDTTRGTTGYAALNWRLFDFGTRRANRQAANSLLVAAMANHDAAIQKTVAATIQAYFDAQSSHALWQAREESASIARDTLASAVRREARGAVAHSDTLQATTAMAQASLERGRNWGNYRKSMAVLTYVLGVPPEIEPSLAEEVDDGDDGSPSLLSDAEFSLPMALSETRRIHPAIQAARANLRAATDRAQATKAEGLPTVDFSANYYRNGYPGQAISSLSSRVNTIGIVINFPIFDGFSHTYKVRGAQAQIEQRADELIDTENNVLMEVVKAHADTSAAWENLKASRVLLNAAQEALATAMRKYDKGAADILEVLNTQTALAEALQERVRCLSEWRSARLRLMANSGTLGRQKIVSEQPSNGLAN